MFELWCTATHFKKNIGHDNIMTNVLTCLEKTQTNKGYQGFIQKIFRRWLKMTTPLTSSSWEQQLVVIVTTCRPATTIEISFILIGVVAGPRVQVPLFHLPVNMLICKIIVIQDNYFYCFYSSSSVNYLLIVNLLSPLIQLILQCGKWMVYYYFIYLFISISTDDHQLCSEKSATSPPPPRKLKARNKD